MRTLLTCLLLLIAGTALASSLTLTVPDAQDAIVVAARDAYNARTVQTLTTKQWALQVLRAAVIAELAQQKQAAADAIVKAKKDDLEATEKAQGALVQGVIDTNSSDAWALPATPRPSPQPTPTVPVEPAGSVTP